jgi:hypothetical protein
VLGALSGERIEELIAISLKFRYVNLSGDNGPKPSSTGFVTKIDGR